MNQDAKAATVCCFVCFVVLAFVLGFCLKTVAPTEIAIEKNWITNRISDEPVIRPGIHVRWPSQTFIKYPKTVENVFFDEKHYDILDGRTLDGLPIIVGVSWQYQLIPEELVDLYKEFEYAENDYLTLFKLHAIHIITEEACKYKASKFFNDKITIAYNMHTVMDKHFKKHLHARVDALQLNSERLPPDFTTTVLNASAMRQNITKAENTVLAQKVVQQTNVRIAEQEAVQMLAEAKGMSANITAIGRADANVIQMFANAERDKYAKVARELGMTPDEVLAYIWFDAVGDGNTVQTGQGMEVFAGINPGAYIKE